MNVIEQTKPEGQPIFIPAHTHSAPKAAAVRDTAVMRIRDFMTMMRIIAKYDLWDEMEAQMAAQGCTSFRLGAQDPISPVIAASCMSTAMPASSS